MSTRATARHRAPVRPRTPLTTMNEALAQRVGPVGRAGAIVAASSGLVISMGMPASAAPRTAASDLAGASSVFGELDTPDDDSPARLDGPPPASLAATARDAKVVFSRGDFAVEAPEPAAVVTPASAEDAVVDDAVTEEAASDDAVTDVADERGGERASRDTEREPIETAAAPEAEVEPAAAPSGSASGVIGIAGQYLGIPYVYGGTTPSGFDCSGFTQFVFGKAGISLPRTTGAQYGATTAISRDEAQPGDLVFFSDGGGPFHVGIFAGGNEMYDSPRTGKSSDLRAIWSSDVEFRRVG